MRDFSPVVVVLPGPMINRGEDLAMSRRIASQLVAHETKLRLVNRTRVCLYSLTVNADEASAFCSILQIMHDVSFQHVYLFPWESAAVV